MKPNQRGVLINGHQSGSCLSAAGSSSILKLKAVPQIVGSKGKRAVRLSTSISALLILVSIGTLTGVNSAWATIRIQDDPGVGSTNICKSSLSSGIPTIKLSLTVTATRPARCCWGQYREAES